MSEMNPIAVLMRPYLNPLFLQYEVETVRESSVILTDLMLRSLTLKQ